MAAVGAQAVSGGPLEALSQAAKALAKAETFEEIKAIRDVATAAKAWAKANDDGSDLVLRAQEIINDATRRLGEMLTATERHRGGRPSNENLSQRATGLAELGVTRSQSSRAQQLAALPEPDYLKLRSKPQNRLLRLARDRAAEAKAANRGDLEAAALEAGTRVDIRHGDFRDVLADLENVDAVITDPPYPREFLPLLADLAAFADKILAPDGVLAVLIGQTYLPDVYRLLDGYRPYRWTAAYLTPGRGYVSHAAAVQSHWKPVLVYGRGRRFDDTFTATGQDAAAKDRHHWGQDYAAFASMIDRLTEPGHVIVDPFMGSGTTLKAAADLGRHAIGCDVDAAHVETARRWLT